MKYLATLALAAAFTGGLAAAVQAAPYEAYEAEVLQGASGVPGAMSDHPHHPCIGLASGTAHASCGTLTGGPSGGLF